MLVALSGLAVWTMMRPGPPAPLPTSRFSITLPPSIALETGGGYGLTLSSDGRTLVYIGSSEGVARQLYRRAMDQLEASLIPGTGGASNPFLSPDGQWVGFLSEDGRSLQKVSLAGGPPLTICECEGNRGASWGPDGTIVFGGVNSGLFRVSADGGIPEALTAPASGVESHVAPRFLPGARAVLFQIVPESVNPQLAVYSFDTDEQTVLDDLGVSLFSAGFSSGHIMFARGDSLWAVPFDVDRLELTGDPFLVLEGMELSPGFDVAQFDVAPGGNLVYVPGGAAGSGDTQRSVVWVDRQGTPTPLWEEPGESAHPQLSPDGTRLALTVRRADNVDVWVYDVERAVPTQVTFGDVRNAYQVWSPDGQYLAYGAVRDDRVTTLFRVPADGSGGVETLVESEILAWAESWSADGRFLAFGKFDPETAQDLWVLPLDGDREPEPFANTDAVEHMAAFAPNGRWIAYATTESGVSEVYVRPYPPGPGKAQVSSNGGGQPRWSADGRELFYRTDSGLMVVAVDPEATPFSYSRAEELFIGAFEGGIWGMRLGVLTRWDYDVAGDGQRFVMFPSERNDGENRVDQVTLVVNWFEELKERVPVN